MKVLVTGGTGSFGKAFVRKLLDEGRHERIVVYSRDELKQTEMAREYDAPNLRFFIGDVRDRNRLKMALRGIDTIVHAAALKHVPVAEYNPSECIATNIGGAENVIHAAIECGVKKVVSLSTDKAVHPVNLYGATKLAAEKLFVAANHLSGKDGPTFSLVRYGNVEGSRGSVIPLFRKMASTGTLTITDPRMTRFWITLDQGVDLVMGALALGNGGDIFIPKIKAGRIVDLANEIAPNAKLEFIGIRPGEKLHETLIAPEEARYVWEMPDYFVLDYLDRWSYGIGRRVLSDFHYTSEVAAA